MGLLATGTSCLAEVYVIGRSRGPRPPERISPRIPFISTLPEVPVLPRAVEGQDHDLHVERQGPVLDVVEVVLDALLERRVASEPVDLRPPREPRLDLVAQHILRDPRLELGDEDRALRPRADEAHLARQHVPELGQLVEREPPERPPEPGRPAVPAARPHRPGLLLGPRGHRPE